MSTFTENYNLIKPDEADYYDVADFNENMDTIETLMAETETAMESISDKIGSPEDTGNNPLFGRLNTGGSFIKSMQTVDLSLKSDGVTVTAPITSVIPARCLVILDILSTNSNIQLYYTLNENSVNASATYHSSTNLEIRLRFQIIEFY